MTTSRKTQIGTRSVCRLQECIAILEGLHRNSLRRQTALEYFPHVLIVINNVNLADGPDVLMVFAPGNHILLHGHISLCHCAASF